MVHSAETKFSIFHKHDFLTIIHKWEPIGYQWKPIVHCLWSKGGQANYKIVYLGVFTSYYRGLLQSILNMAAI